MAFDFDGNFSTSSESVTLPKGTEEFNPGTPPSVPADLAGDTTTSGGQTQAQLTWTPSTSTVAVSGYNIYRNNNYRTTVFTNAYTDTVRVREIITYPFRLSLRPSGKAREGRIVSYLTDEQRSRAGCRGD